MEVCLDQTDSTRGQPSEGLGYQCGNLAAAAAVIDGGENYHVREWGSFEEELLDQQQGQFAGRPEARWVILLVAGNGKYRLVMAGGKEGAVSFELLHQLIVSAHGVA